MPRQSGTTPTTPLGITPPASENGFAFANGEFFAEVSGHHLHRRANLAELKEHFASGSDKDHPAHWFEAQLIHHGLPPSKTKAVARMRLFDAVNAGKLKVPADVFKLEGKLKKEWTKNDRDAKKTRKGGGEVKNKTVTTPKTTTKTTKTTKITKKTTTMTTTTLKATGTKRKASDNASATTTSTPLGRPATKKTKTTLSKDSRAPTSSSTQETPAPRTKQTARCSRGNRSQGQGLGRGASTALPPPAPSSRPRQTARRSGSFAARGRITAPPAPPRVEGGYSSYSNNSYYDDENDEPPPPYSEFDHGSDSHSHEDDSHVYDSDPYGEVGDPHGEDSDSYGEEGELRPLGLLNGRYDLTSSEVSSQWPSCGSEFDLVFTISESSMWASFDLGIVEGVMYFAQRPMKSSHDRVPFTWRGEEREGPIVYGDENEGWIKFLGDGRIEGQLEWMGLDFRGRRLPGQGTRSEIEAYTLRSRWEGYSEEEYDRLSRARWH